MSEIQRIKVNCEVCGTENYHDLYLIDPNQFLNPEEAYITLSIWCQHCNSRHAFKCRMVMKEEKVYCDIIEPIKLKVSNLSLKKRTSITVKPRTKRK